MLNHLIDEVLGPFFTVVANFLIGIPGEALLFVLTLGRRPARFYRWTYQAVDETSPADLAFLLGLLFWGLLGAALVLIF